MYRKVPVPGLFERTLRDGSKVYECKTRVGGKIVSKRLATEHGKVGEARREVEAIRSGAAPTTPGRLTLDALAEQAFEAQDAEAARGARSLRGVETAKQRYWSHVSPVLGSRDAAALELADLRRLLDTLRAKELAGNTATGILNTLSAVLSFGTEWKLIERNPVRDLPRRSKPGTKPTKQRRVLTTAELDSLLGHLSSSYKGVGYLCAYMGLRVSEALGLTWADVDLAARTLNVEQQRGAGNTRVALKTSGSAAVMTMPPAVVDELSRLRKAQAAKSFTRIAPDALVFPTQDRHNARRAVARAAEKAGLNVEGRKTVSPHDLRHTFVACAHAAGLSLPQVSGLARHKTPRVTLEVYSTLGEEARRDAASDLYASGFGG